MKSPPTDAGNRRMRTIILVVSLVTLSATAVAETYRIDNQVWS